MTGEPQVPYHLSKSVAVLSVLAGDVLQLPVPVRGAHLLPDPGSAAEGLRGWDSSHVHTQGKV